MYKLEIMGETPEELVRNLFGIAGKLTVEPAPAPAPVAPAAPAPAPAMPTAAPMPTPAPVPVAPAPAPVAHAPVPAPVVPTAAVRSYSLDEVGTAGADMIRDDPGKMGALLALLGQFGVQAITELRPEQVGPFVTALRGLGAKI